MATVLGTPNPGDVLVQLQVFSGRNDPRWTLSPTQIGELVGLIGRLTQYTNLKPPAVAGRLDYRGFLITASANADVAPETTVLVHAGIIDRHRFALNLVDEDNRVERFLLACAPSDQVDAVLRRRIESQIHFVPPIMPRVARRTKQKRRRGRTRKTPKPKAGPGCRPQYEPDKWNTPAHQGPNHCYEYAADVMRDLGSIPGEGGGHACCGRPAGVNCRAVKEAAVLDGLTPVTDISAPPHGHYVALVVEPPGSHRDFHWYRLDCNGSWSHKVGNSPVTNLDSSDKPITDPRTCDRGTYTTFCGFFDCDPAKVRIGP